MNQLEDQKTETTSTPCRCLYSAHEIRTLRVRGKARTLTKLCVACRDLGACALGQRLERLYRTFCEPQVGDDFRHCCRCSRARERTCPVDHALFGAELHAQLGVCTRKRGLEMPFSITRWDILFG